MVFLLFLISERLFFLQQLLCDPFGDSPSEFDVVRHLGMAEKVKNVAIEEANRIRVLSSEAARSGVYLYPLRVRRRPSLFLPTS